MSAAALRMAPELAQADILVGNDDEFSILCGGDKDKGLDIARAHAKNGQLVLYKRGDLGCILFCKDNMIKTGIFPVKVMKPFGAGDAFLGNFLSRLSIDGNVCAAVLQSSAAAYLVVAQRGCASAMPDKQQLR